MILNSKNVQLNQLNKADKNLNFKNHSYTQDKENNKKEINYNRNIRVIDLFQRVIQ